MSDATITEVVGKIIATPDHHAVVKGSKVKYRFIVDERPFGGMTVEDEELDESPPPADWQTSGFNWDPGQIGKDAFKKTGRTTQVIPIDIVAEHNGYPTGKKLASMLTWYVIYDKHVKQSGQLPYQLIGHGKNEIEIEWKHHGQHVVMCCIGYRRPTEKKSNTELAADQILFTQRVNNVKAIQQRRMKAQRKRKIPNPWDERLVAEKYLEALEKAEEHAPVPEDKRKAYEKEKKQREKYLDNLDILLRGYRKGSGQPIRASYVAKNSSEQADLRVCIFSNWGEIFMDRDAETWVTIVDWTNPLTSKLRGRYFGKGKDYHAALKAALEEWKDDNEYYHPGRVVLEIPELFSFDRSGPQKFQRHTFDTPGASFWDKLKEFLDWIAMGTGLLATAIMLISPVPGSRVVAGLMLAAIFTSSGSSIIGIGRRKRDGFADATDDLLDMMTLVGNVFTAGRIGWARRAAIATKAISSRHREFFLFGETAVDAIEGMLIARQTYSQFEEILSDPTLSPSERVDKMLGLLSSAGAKGAMRAVSIKARRVQERARKRMGKKRTKLDEDGDDDGSSSNNNGSAGSTDSGSGKKKGGKKNDGDDDDGKLEIEPDMLKRLNDPNEVIDIDKNPKRKGHTKDRAHRTRTVDDPERARKKKARRKSRRNAKRNKRRKRGKLDFPEPPSPQKRGMRKQDDLDFQDEVLENKKIILVRDSNEDAIKWMNGKARPKPVELKAKTLKQGEHAGLAAADPNSQPTRDMLAAMKSPKTGKPPMAYDEYVEMLDNKGLKVDPSRDHIIVDKKTGEAFYSDLDLHGVYDPKTGRSAYNEGFRNRMNDRFGGKELIQHGPHDEWPDRNKKKAGPNRGPQPPVTAYIPVKGKVKKVWLETKQDLKDFYESWGLPWKERYPNDWDFDD